MKKAKYLMGLLAFSLLLTGCNGNSSEPGSEDSRDDSQPTVESLFSAQGYSEVTGWPVSAITSLFTREDVKESWVNSNIPLFTLPSGTTKVYAKHYSEESELIIYKSYEIALPTAEDAYITSYSALFKEAIWDVSFDDELGYYNIKQKDGDDKIAIRLLSVEESELLPAASYFTFTVREKEEFVGAPRPSKDAVRSNISFVNNYKIMERNQEEVVWNFQGFTFSVLQGSSDKTVGNIPNNNGAGYLYNPLRVYENQQLVMEVDQNYQIEQLIFHTSAYFEQGVEVDTLFAFARDIDGVQIYTTDDAILYHFTDKVMELTLTLLADTRLSEAVAIYSHI